MTKQFVSTISVMPKRLNIFIFGLLLNFSFFVNCTNQWKEIPLIAGQDGTNGISLNYSSTWTNNINYNYNSMVYYPSSNLETSSMSLWVCNLAGGCGSSVPGTNGDVTYSIPTYPTNPPLTVNYRGIWTNVGPYYLNDMFYYISSFGSSSVLYGSDSLWLCVNANGCAVLAPSNTNSDYKEIPLPRGNPGTPLEYIGTYNIEVLYTNNEMVYYTSTTSVTGDYSLFVCTVLLCPAGIVPTGVNINTYWKEIPLQKGPVNTVNTYSYKTSGQLIINSNTVVLQGASVSVSVLGSNGQAISSTNPVTLWFKNNQGIFYQKVITVSPSALVIPGGSASYANILGLTLQIGGSNGLATFEPRNIHVYATDCNLANSVCLAVSLDWYKTPDYTYTINSLGTGSTNPTALYATSASVTTPVSYIGCFNSLPSTNTWIFNTPTNVETKAQPSEIGAWQNWGALSFGSTSGVPPIMPSTVTISRVLTRRIGQVLKTKILYAKANTEMGTAGVGMYLFMIPGLYSLDTSTGYTYYTQYETVLHNPDAGPTLALCTISSISLYHRPANDIDNITPALWSPRSIIFRYNNMYPYGVGRVYMLGDSNDAYLTAPGTFHTISIDSDYIGFSSEFEIPISGWLA
jgi:hypothetical protein